jgi:hypothetical protein
VHADLYCRPSYVPLKPFAVHGFFSRFDGSSPSTLLRTTLSRLIPISYFPFYALLSRFLAMRLNAERIAVVVLARPVVPGTRGARNTLALGITGDNGTVLADTVATAEHTGALEMTYCAISPFVPHGRPSLLQQNTRSHSPGRQLPTTESLTGSCRATAS